jgi:Flp pilus assembly pilin Flp
MLRSLLQDEEGLETVEWVLLLAAFVVPFIAAMLHIVGMLSYFYSVTSWVTFLPFP